MEFDPKTYRIVSGTSLGRNFLIAGIAGLALSLIGYFIDTTQFFHSYLVAFMFWLTIGLGGLFFVMVHYLTNATWSVVIRRVAENIMATLPLMALFSLPLLLGTGELYHWSHVETVQGDVLLEGKSPYLNVPFFIIRVILYFLIWIILSRYLYKISLEQDRNPSDSLIPRARRISALGMILFAVTITFSSFDYLMSLDPHWYSTIFGVYVFAGSFLGLLAFLTLFVIYLRGEGVLKEVVTSEHFHDLGKLLFSFIIFWGYMAFSQYFLIWYGNIPEESIWFLHRWEGSWRYVTLAIVFGHFLIPFFILFPMAVKRNMVIMSVMSVWILLIHWIDLYWMVMPSLHQHGVHFSWIDITSTVGIGGIFIWLFWKRMLSNPAIPINDPRLKESIEIVS